VTTADYHRIERAIRFLEANFRSQPTLSEVAEAVGLSEFHFQRLFRRWAGISPKRFLQFVTASYADTLLPRRTVLDTAYEVGLSGTARLHDLMVNVHAATPGEIRTGGRGVTIDWGVHESAFGDCLIASTSRGICALAFIMPRSQEDALDELRRRWPNASLRHEPDRTAALAANVFGNGTQDIDLHVRGTNFQIRVWEALLRLGPGQVASYGDIATGIGRPEASRAVGQAVGANPVAYLIPCHRVIRGTGAFGGYHWGEDRKRIMLGWERARAEAGPEAA